MASIAVFVALGGTSYALTALPRNSVGPKQIRSGAVGSSEIRTGAVRSNDIRNRAIGLRDISVGARRVLRGAQGPPGPPGPVGPPGALITAAVDATGGVRSNIVGAGASHGPGTGLYDVDFNRDLRACYAVASLSRPSDGVAGGANAGEVVVSTEREGVIVRTRNSSGAPADLPFHLIVVC
jgi:hypothetical protein